MKRASFALGAVLLAACTGQPSGAAPHSSSRPSSVTIASAGSAAIPSSSTLFAVLETRRAGGHESEIGSSHDTIAIADSDGYAKAKATFAPRHIPEVPMAAAVVYPEAHVAASGVYFIDGTGTVHRLDLSGAVRQVTAFPIRSPQQLVSFAVSPDGKRLMAAVLGYPSVTWGSDQSKPFVLSGSWTLDLELADDGGSATVVHHWESGATDAPGSARGFHPIAVVAWDDNGPVAVADTAVGIQQVVLDGQHWAGDGQLVRLGLDGSMRAIPMASPCSPFSVEPMGELICLVSRSNLPSEVRALRADGSIWFNATEQQLQAAPSGGFTLSPDTSRLAMDGLVYLQGGSAIPIAETFLPRGWLDNETLIGLVRGPEPIKMGVVRLKAPGTLDNWGFTGQFVGVIGK